MHCTHTILVPADTRLLSAASLDMLQLLSCAAGKLNLATLDEPLVEVEVGEEKVTLSRELMAAVDPGDPNKMSPLSKMSLGMLQAELQLRGLSLTGSRKDLYRRVQVCVLQVLLCLSLEPPSGGAAC